MAIPQTPSGLTIAVQSGFTSVLSSWTAEGDGGSSITYYSVRASPEGENNWVTHTRGLLIVPFNASDDNEKLYVGLDTSLLIGGFTANSSYDFQVRATNADGNSPWSASTTTSLSDITLSDFDSTGLQADVLALIERTESGDVYYRDSDRGGTDIPIDGELGMGSGNTLISRIRLLSSDVLLINDNNNPAPLVMSEYFTNGGSDLTLWIQTFNGVASVTVNDSYDNAGGNFVRFLPSSAMSDLLNDVDVGSRFIIAFTRAAPTIETSISLDLVDPTITVGSTSTILPTAVEASINLSTSPITIAIGSTTVLNPIDDSADFDLSPLTITIGSTSIIVPTAVTTSASLSLVAPSITVGSTQTLTPIEGSANLLLANLGITIGSTSIILPTATIGSASLSLDNLEIAVGSTAVLSPIETSADFSLPAGTVTISDTETILPSDINSATAFSTASATISVDTHITFNVSTSFTAGTPIVTVSNTATELPSTVEGDTSFTTNSASLSVSQPTVIAPVNAAINFTTAAITIEAAIQEILSLAAFDDTGLEADVLALIERTTSGNIYYADADRGGTDTPIAGDLGLGPGNTLISRIRKPNNNSILINDNDNPVTLGMSDYFGNGGSDLTLWIQTIEGVDSQPVDNNIATVGGNFLRVLSTTTMNSLLNNVGIGDRFIIAFTRPVADVESSIAFDLEGNPPINIASTEIDLPADIDTSASLTTANLSIGISAFVVLETDISFSTDNIEIDVDTSIMLAPTLEPSIAMTTLSPTISISAVVGLLSSVSLTTQPLALSVGSTSIILPASVAASISLTTANPTIDIVSSTVLTPVEGSISLTASNLAANITSTEIGLPTDISAIAGLSLAGNTTITVASTAILAPIDGSASFDLASLTLTIVDTEIDIPSDSVASISLTTLTPNIDIPILPRVLNPEEEDAIFELDAATITIGSTDTILPSDANTSVAFTSLSPSIILSDPLVGLISNTAFTTTDSPTLTIGSTSVITPTDTTSSIALTTDNIDIDIAQPTVLSPSDATLDSLTLASASITIGNTEIENPLNVNSSISMSLSAISADIISTGIFTPVAGSISMTMAVASIDIANTAITLPADIERVIAFTTATPAIAMVDDYLTIDIESSDVLARVGSFISLTLSSANISIGSTSIISPADVNTSIDMTLQGISTIAISNAASILPTTVSSSILFTTTSLNIGVSNVSTEVPDAVETSAVLTISGLNIGITSVSNSIQSTIGFDLDNMDLLGSAATFPVQSQGSVLRGIRISSGMSLSPPGKPTLDTLTGGSVDEMPDSVELVIEIVTTSSGETLTGEATGARVVKRNELLEWPERAIAGFFKAS